MNTKPQTINVVAWIIKLFFFSYYSFNQCPFINTIKTLSYGGGVVVGCSVYCEVSQGVYWCFSSSYTFPLLLFLHYYPIHTRPVWTLVTSPQQKKMVWEQNPNYNVFSILAPKTRKQQNKWGKHDTHTSSIQRRKNIHTTRRECSSFFGQGYVPVK